jgi:signal transduction histidine kinase
MSRRNAILLGLFFVLFPIGVWLSIEESTPLLVKAGRDALPDPLTRTGLAEIARTLQTQVQYLMTLFSSDAELLIYGGLAFFGILMMLLVIQNATSSGADPHRTALDLLKQEKQRAENLARIKSEFLNQVSHELRTPLAVIIGYLECMTDGLYGQIESKHQEILQLVAKQSTHLKNMIDQILIFSRLEASKQPIRIEEVSVHETLAEVKDTFDFLCRQKGLSLAWDVPPSLPPLKTDAERIKEILSNLLQNAVKYTDQGSVSLKLKESPEPGSITVEVMDSGIGIPEHLLETIFEPFVQVHKTSAENSRGGIGLGLSIVKKHVEQLSGTICAESELGKGSTFKVVLPTVYKISQEKNLWTLYNTLRQRHLRFGNGRRSGDSGPSKSAARSNWVQSK